MALKCCVASQSKWAPSHLGTKEWLQAAARGSYTAARTVHENSILQLTFHIERLAQSSKLMIEAGGQVGQQLPSAEIRSWLVNPDLLRPRVVASMKTGIEGFKQLNPGYSGEMRVTVLLAWEDAQGEEEVVATHVSQLPTSFKRPVKVQVRGNPRSNALAKDSEWVRERVHLEQDQPPDVSEILLVGPDGEVFEGMTSNFFVIQGGSVVTAEEGVLHGTVRDMVLQVCRQEGIPIELRPPSLSESDHWQDAFITSTSRLVLPVDHLTAPEADPQLSMEFPVQGLVQRIQQLVEQEVERFAEPLELQ